MRHTMFALIALAIAASAAAQSRSEDEYTRYELLAPETSTFKISYELAAVTPGAKIFFNAIHNATQVSDLSAIDLMTGAALKIGEVTGQQARAAGLKDADPAVRYLQVDLARPVPDGGEVRIRIHKTYKDAPTYHREGDAVVFARALTVSRDIVVLPPGYEILSANVPVQVIEQPDGRIAVSLMNTYPGAAPLVLKARAVSAQVLKTRTLTGADVVREKIDIPDRVEPGTQLVLIPFTPVKKGQSVRLRISETYTDPARYALVDGQLMWHRSFGRPRNDMVLPAGWYLTTSSIPAVITQEPDGRIRLSFWNPRPDNVAVYVKARRR